MLKHIYTRLLVLLKSFYVILLAGCHFGSHIILFYKRMEILKLDKFKHLNSFLEGLASHTIQGLSLTEVNYDLAVELLQTRFENPQ